MVVWDGNEFVPACDDPIFPVVSPDLSPELKELLEQLQADREKYLNKSINPRHTRMNIARLLRCCDELVALGLNTQWEQKRLERNLQHAQRLWHELAALSEQREMPNVSAEVRESGCTEQELGEFRRRIERLAELLDGDKLLSGAGSGLALAQAQCNAGLTREQANAELANRLAATSRMQAQLRDQLFGPTPAPAPVDASSSATPASATAAESTVVRAPLVAAYTAGDDLTRVGPATEPGAARCSMAAGVGVSAGGSDSGDGAGVGVPSITARESLLGAATATSRRGGGADGAEAESLSATLASQRAQQDDALADLAQMAGGLRERSLKAQQSLRQQCSTLDTTSAAVDANRSKLEQNSSKLRQQLQSMRSSTCYILMMLLMVVGLFTFTFMIMKVAPKPIHKPPLMPAPVPASTPAKAEL